MVPMTLIAQKEREQDQLRALCDAFVAKGGKIKKIKKGRHYSESKKGGAIVGPTTAGRAGTFIYG